MITNGGIKMSNHRPAHIGRSFSGTEIEDDCPCEKAPCGLAIDSGVNTDQCAEHSIDEGKAIRQLHSADACPGKEDLSG